MRQAKFSIEVGHEAFLSRHARYGFQDRSAVVRAALDQLMAQIEQRRIAESAALYAVDYAEDATLQELTEAALADVPDDTD